MPTRIITLASTPGFNIPINEEINNNFYEYVQEQKKINPDYFDIKCTLSLDFIKLSVLTSDQSLHSLKNEVIGRKTSPEKINRNANYDYDESWSIEFKLEGNVHAMNILKSNTKAFLPKIITLHHPTEELLKFTELHLKNKAWHHVKEIEFSFDFEHEDKEMIRNFIKNHFTIKWRGKGFYHPSETEYFANIRFARGKGGRLYEKELGEKGCESREVTRLEVLLKRPVLYRSGVTKIPDLLNMNIDTVTKYFTFKEFNYRLLKKRLLENELSIEQVKIEFNQVKESIDNGKLYDLNSSIVSIYKKYPSDGFLINHSFQKHFINRISGKSFLNRDTIMVSTGLMDDKIFDDKTMSLLK